MPLVKRLVTTDSDDKPKTRGDGAGGAATNKSGKPWEQATSNEPNLYRLGFVRNRIDPEDKTSKEGYVMQKGNVTYTTQSGFSKYILKKFRVEKIHRRPDEAYIMEEGNNHYRLFIVEKKKQQRPGSTEDKLYVLYGIIKEMKRHLAGSGHWEIHGILCVCSYFQGMLSDKEVMKEVLTEDMDIKILFGESDSYFHELNVEVLGIQPSPGISELQMAVANVTIVD